MDGRELIRLCKDHVRAAIRDMPDCQPGAVGTTTGQIEEKAKLALNLRKHNRWFTYSIVHALIDEGCVEVVLYQDGKRPRHKYRLVECGAQPVSDVRRNE